MRLGPLYVVCDAPPYAIVESCVAIGIDRPQDVRWRYAEKFGGICCEGKRVQVCLWRFTLSTGDVVDYSIGQCPRCKTCWWKA